MIPREAFQNNLVSMSLKQTFPTFFFVGGPASLVQNFQLFEDFIKLNLKVHTQKKEYAPLE